MMRPVGSYWNVPDSDYQELPVGTPGWQDAPVPGWGINPLRAGPMRVGIGLGGGIWDEDGPLPRYTPIGSLGDHFSEDAETLHYGGSIPWQDAVLPNYFPLGADPEAAYHETSYGVVAGGMAIGIGLGILFGYAWWGQKHTS
jgi:hypothetical protein